jgi:signal transduction histidine kinase
MDVSQLADHPLARRLGPAALAVVVVVLTGAVMRDAPDGLWPARTAWPSLLALGVTVLVLAAGGWGSWAFVVAACVTSLLSGVPFPMMVAVFALVRRRRYRSAAAATLALAVLGMLGPGADVLMSHHAPLANVAHALVEALVPALAALLANHHERLRAAEGALREGAERERAQHLRLRLAQSAHDGVGHRISLMVLQSAAIESTTTAAQREIRERCTAIGDAGRAAMGELAQVIQVLREQEHLRPPPPPGPVPDFGDLPALVGLYRSHDQDIQLDLDPVAPRLPAAVQEAAYRVVEEGLSNVLRHAPGATTRITCRADGRLLLVEVANTAPGVAPRTAPGTGTGLTSLAERTAALGGTLTARRTPAGGHLLAARIPLTGGPK